MSKNKNKNKLLTETSAILGGAGIGAVSGYRYHHKLPVSGVPSKLALGIAAGAGLGAVAGEKVVNHKETLPAAMIKATGTLAGQAVVPVPGVGGAIGHEVTSPTADKVDKYIKKNTEKHTNNVKNHLKNNLTLVGGTGLVGGGVATALKSQGMRKKFKGYKAEHGVKWVIEGPVRPHEVLMGAKTTTLKGLKNSSRDSKDLIGILGGRSLFNKDFWKEDLKNYTGGKVHANFKDMPNIEDKLKFYQLHEASGKMPKTVAASKIKSSRQLKKIFGEGNYVMKKRLGYAGRGVITDNSNTSQFTEHNKEFKENFKTMEDAIGNDKYVFQEKLKMPSHFKGEYRVSAANGKVLSVLPRDAKGELAYGKSRFIFSKKRAKELDKIRDFTQSFVDKDLKVNPKGVHAFDILKDSAGKHWVLESNAANGANFRNPVGDSFNVVKAYTKNKAPISYAAKRRFLLGGTAAAAIGTGILAKAIRDKYMEKKSSAVAFVPPTKQSRILQKAMLGSLALPAVAGGTTLAKTNDPDKSLIAAGAGTAGISGLTEYIAHPVKKLSDKKSVAIITGNPESGGGHVAPAKEIAKEFKRRGYKTDLYDSKAFQSKGVEGQDAKNIRKYINDFKNTATTDEYLLKSRMWDQDIGQAKKFSLIKKLRNKAIDAGKGVQSLVTGTSVMSHDLAKHDYGTIINTIPGGEKPLRGTNRKVINLVTDYGIANKMWEDPAAYGYVFPSKESQKEFNGIFPRAATKAARGLPIGEAHILAKDNKASAIKDQYKRIMNSNTSVLKGANEENLKLLDIKKKWIPVVGGANGMSVAHATDALEKSLKKHKNGKDYQIIAVAGPHNKTQFDYLAEKYKGRKDVVTLSEGHFPSLFRSSDIIAARPGGATTNELRAHGKPVINVFSDFGEMEKVKQDIKEKGPLQANHEMKNADFLKKYLDSEVMYASDSLSTDKALHSTIDNYAKKRKIAEEHAKKFRGMKVTENVVDQIEALRREAYHPVNYKGIRKVLPKTPLGKGFGTLAAGLVGAGAIDKYLKSKNKN